MPSKRRTDRLLAAAALLLAGLLAACSSSSNSSNSEPHPPPAPTMPDDVVSVAQAAFGPDGEALAYGDFPEAGGRHVLAVNRLAAAAQPGAAAPAAAQNPETTVDVIRVSILVHTGTSWMESFHADEHLKNRRGYLDRIRVPVSSWRMHYEKTPDSGFRLEFTPLNLPPGTKLETVHVAWNPKRKEYDSLDPSGKRFLEPLPTPGGQSVKVDDK